MKPLDLLSRLVTRRRAFVVLWTALALVAAGAVVFGFTDPPDRVVADEIDGRTWLPVARADGAALVLANGISGLVEAEADASGSLPTGLRFGGSDSRFTLLGTDGESVVVADGSHVTSTVDTGDGASSVLAGAGLVTAADEITVRPIAPTGEVGAPVTLTDAGTPTPGVAPIVDGEGDAWVLAGETAVRIDDSGRVASRVDVAPSAAQLLVVDGRPYVRTTDSIDALDRGHRLPGAGDRGVVPSVAQSVGEQWAVASGRRIAVGADGSSTVDAPDTVRSLAVWYGHVWAATDDAAIAIRDGEARPVGDIAGPFEVFTDGGRLWFVSDDGAIAIDRRQQPTVFRLAGVDLSLCVGDCSPEAAVDYLDEVTPTTAPESGTAPTTTLPPPDITLPPVVPTAPPTTTVPPSTTVPPTTPPTTQPPATTPPPETVATTVATVPASTVPAPTLPAETLPPPPDTDPPRPPDPPPPPPTRPPAPPTPSPAPETTLPPAAPGGGVILAFADGDPITGSTATVQIGFDGDAATCAANGGAVLGRSTLGQLNWSGAGNGPRTVALRLERGAASETFDVEPGSLSVSFTVCGLSASISRTVRGEPPAMGDISISGTPTEGAQLTASVGYSYGAGWSVGNASWTGGPCGTEESLGSGSTGPESSSASFTASAPGDYCVAVVVSFVAEGGGGTEETRSSGINVAPGSTTTTDPAATTTTTDPSATTSTDASATTTPPPSTEPPTTPAPTTTPPTTVPATTAPPDTTTTTTLPSTTTTVAA